MAVGIPREHEHVVARLRVAVTSGLAFHEHPPVIVEVVGADGEAVPHIAHLVAPAVIAIGEFDDHRLLDHALGLHEVAREGVGFPATDVLIAELVGLEAEYLVGVPDTNHHAIKAPLRAVVALDDPNLVAVEALGEYAATATGLGVVMILDVPVYQLPVGGLEFILGDAGCDVTPGVVHLVGVVAVAIGEFENRALPAEVLGAEVDVGGYVGLPATLLLVAEMGRVSVEWLLEVSGANRHVVESSGHTRVTCRANEKRTECGNYRRRLAYVIYGGFRPVTRYMSTTQSYDSAAFPAPNPVRLLVLSIGPAFARFDLLDRERAVYTADLLWPRVVTGLARMPKNAIDVVMMGIVSGTIATTSVGFAEPY